MEIPALGTVLCPVDLSDHARAALYLATGLSQHDTSRLVVLRVAGGNPAKARGRGALGRRVLGSTTSALLRESSVPVVGSEEPGKLVYELLRQDRAVVAMIP